MLPADDGGIAAAKAGVLGARNGAEPQCVAGLESKKPRTMPGAFDC